MPSDRGEGAHPLDHVLWHACQPHHPVVRVSSVQVSHAHRAWTSTQCVRRVSTLLIEDSRLLSPSTHRGRAQLFRACRSTQSGSGSRENPDHALRPRRTIACRRLPPASARTSRPLPAAPDAWRCYDFPCQEWTATFLRLHDFFVLSASEKPEPVRSDG